MDHSLVKIVISCKDLGKTLLTCISCFKTKFFYLKCFESGYGWDIIYEIEPQFGKNLATINLSCH